MKAFFWTSPLSVFLCITLITAPVWAQSGQLSREPQPAVASDPAPPQPGQLSPGRQPADTTNPAATKTGATPADPTVSVTRTSAADAPHNSHAKWYVLLAVIAAAGAGGAFAMKGKSNTAPAPASSSISIGAPTISVGHP